IKIKGAGGHGAYPHQTKDSIVIGAELVSQLQTIVSRKINPIHTAVLTIGQFNAGTAFNIIADEAELIGTVRFFDLDIQEQIINEMQQIIDGMKKTHNIEIILDRKSTRLNSSHVSISYAVFCFKTKTTNNNQ